MTPTRPGWIALAVACLAYTALYVWLYPPLPTIEDEIGFVNQALVWSRGAASSEGAGFDEVDTYGRAGDTPHLMDFVPVGGRHLPSRHPGRSLLLLPFVLVGGVDAGFASGLLIHLGVVLVGALLLVRLGRSPLWASLLLLHPTLAVYSRTIMGDEAAGGCILLAALAATFPGRRGAIGAGLACGLAALMRYHAGLSLAAVALAVALDRDRPRRRSDALACLTAGGLVGLAIVAYNLALYGKAGDANGAARGAFGLEYVPGNLAFYAAALLALWPGMLVAPILDRSRARWVARGVCGGFLAFFAAYYFHDRGGSAAQTLVLGLRLLQVALPAWIVSYATVVDDLVAGPIRARVGPRAGFAVGLALIAAMLGADSVVFARHQDYLGQYRAVRAAMVRHVPAGSVVATAGGVQKPFGVPRDGVTYRWRLLDYHGEAIADTDELDRLREPWYIALMHRPGATIPGNVGDLVARYRMRRIETDAAALELYRADPGLPPGGPPR